MLIAVSCTFGLSACSEENNENDDEYFEDVPQAYILTGSTKPAGKLLKNYNNVYRIRNAAELKYFIDLVNQTDDYVANGYFNFQLEHDIEIDESYNWKPIGYSEEYQFSGIFDGMGHKITGTLNIYNTPIVQGTELINYLGFFGITNGEIKNLTMDADVNICVSLSSDTPRSRSKIYIGCVTSIVMGEVHNCTVNSKLTIKTASQGVGCYAIGGLCGAIGLGNFQDCLMNGRFNLGKLKHENIIIGGICGTCYSSGSSSGGSFQTCINQTDIKLDNFQCDFLAVGGILGASEPARTTDYLFSTYLHKCTNQGSISVTNGKFLYTPEENYYNYNVGGICGYVRESGSNEGCVNEADIYTENLEEHANVGGIAGYINSQSSFQNFINSGNITNVCDLGSTGGIAGRIYGSEISYCENSGMIASKTTSESSDYSGWTGGIAGHATNSIHKCINTGDIIGEPNPENDYGHTGAIAGYGEVYACCNNNGYVCGELSKDNPLAIFVGRGANFNTVPANKAEYVSTCHIEH